MKCYVINCKDATDRLKSIKKEMSKTGLSYEVVNPKPSDEHIEGKKGWTDGANSLRLTTIDLVKKAKHRGEDMIWIWEDDCVINESSFNHFMRFDKPIGFDFIHLNNSGGLLFSAFNEGCFRRTIDGVWNCQSYIISNRVYDEYLDGLKVKRPIDSTTKLIHQKNKRSYIVEPEPVSHTPNRYSYIRDKIVNY